MPQHGCKYKLYICFCDLRLHMLCVTDREILDYYLDYYLTILGVDFSAYPLSASWKEACGSSVDVRVYYVLSPASSHLRVFIHNASRTLKWRISVKNRLSNIKRQKQFSKACADASELVTPHYFLVAIYVRTYVRVEREKICTNFFHRIHRSLAGWLVVGGPSRNTSPPFHIQLTPPEKAKFLSFCKKYEKEDVPFICPENIFFILFHYSGCFITLCNTAARR